MASDLRKRRPPCCRFYPNRGLIIRRSRVQVSPAPRPLTCGNVGQGLPSFEAQLAYVTAKVEIARTACEFNYLRVGL
jgi:hypothetical protein